MPQFAVLITQIFVIACVQWIIEMFIDSDRKTMVKMVDIACYLGSLYLLLDFLYKNVISELMKTFSNIF